MYPKIVTFSSMQEGMKVYTKKWNILGKRWYLDRDQGKIYVEDTKNQDH